MLRMLAGLLAGLAVADPAFAQGTPANDTLRIAIGQRGLWDASVPELGQRGGIFKQHGITLDILYTQGGARPSRR